MPVAVTGGLHVTAAVLALVAALVVLRRPKGTRAHVRLGWAYVGLLVVVDVAALLTYEDAVSPGPFHVLAVVSLLTVGAGIALAPRRAGARVPHAVFMVWSVAGLVAAGLAQATTAWFADVAPWPTVGSSIAVCAVAGVATRRIVRGPDTRERARA